MSIVLWKFSQQPLRRRMLLTVVMTSRKYGKFGMQYSHLAFGEKFTDVKNATYISFTVKVTKL